MTAHLKPVEPVVLEHYPAELCDPRLTNDYFTMFWHDRWLSSRMHLTASMAVQGAALNLFFLSRKQIPVGSLPSDEKLLARMLRVSEEDWRGMMAQEITPLHHWREFEHEGEIVLGHSVVIEVALDALDKREARKASNEERAVRVRIARLIETMRDAGCSKEACGDSRLVEWLDGWLLENHRGQRRRPQIDASLKRALAAAAQAGVLKQHGNGR